MSFLPAKATPSAIDFNGLSKRFGGVQALDKVSFGVARGECHALMGENGAGKSTLGKILAGNHRPDAGSLCSSHGHADEHEQDRPNQRNGRKHDSKNGKELLPLLLQ